jgi:hypothetical protein
MLAERGDNAHPIVKADLHAFLALGGDTSSLRFITNLPSLQRSVRNLAPDVALLEAVRTNPGRFERSGRPPAGVLLARSPL